MSEERPRDPPTAPASPRRGDPVEDVEDQPDHDDGDDEKEDLTDRREDPGAGQPEEAQEVAADPTERESAS